MRDTLIIFACLVVGGLVGYFNGIPEFLPKETTSYLIFILMFVIGLDLGNDVERLKSMTQLRWELLLLPLLTIVGSLLGGAVSTIFLKGYGMVDGMAVSAGLGYYSVSSVIISEAVGPTLGFIALFSNVLRETLTMLFSPIFAKLFGPLAPIALGGASTADVTLPIILNSSGQEYLLPSLFHGFVNNISVPIVVGFCCSFM